MLSSFQADFPVCDGDQLRGLLTHSRLIKALHELGADTAVSEVMQTDIVPVSPDEDLFDAQQRMSKERLDVLPVVDDGRFLGLLTNRDVLEVFQLINSQPQVLSKASSLVEQQAPI
jgi:CBS domain-containing protein